MRGGRARAAKIPKAENDVTAEQRKKNKKTAASGSVRGRTAEREIASDGGAAAGRSAPQRRCICCRGNGKRVDLLRFAVADGMLRFDLRKKLPGRGYYVCAQRHCLEKAFATGFKRVAKRDPSALSESAASFIETIALPGLRKRLAELLQAGLGCRQLLVGADSVEEAAKLDVLGCYILATDASAATKKKYRMNAQRKGLPCVGLFDRACFGQLLGKSDKAVLGWLKGSLCETYLPLEAAIRRLSGMPDETEESSAASDAGEDR